MKQTTIVAIVLGVLVLISLAQAFQLNGLKTKLVSGDSTSSVGINSPTTAGSGSERTVALPKSVKDLPQMVGGC